MNLRPSLHLRLLSLSAALCPWLCQPALHADQVLSDDVIIQGSLGVGFDAVNGEVFGFDTLVLKENNLRIFFNDTSSSALFPTNDWRIVINDTTNGGKSFFGIDDVTAGRRPFTLSAGAPADSFFIGSSGFLGLGTPIPAKQLHISAGNTPTVRLDQSGNGGYPAQFGISWEMKSASPCGM